MSPRNPCLLVPLLLVLGIALIGCTNVLRQLPGQPDYYDLKAKYTDLANRRVAVVVSVSDYTDFNYPDARPFITREISRRIVAGVPGATVSDPQAILDWQKDNPYWATRTPSAIIEQLKVDRLVLVEIGQFRTHEPGDKYVMRGMITATVNIIEAEAADPDNFAASYNRTVMFPRNKDTDIGVAGPTVSEEAIAMKTMVWFCEETAGLFYDHTLER